MICEMRTLDTIYEISVAIHYKVAVISQNGLDWLFRLYFPELFGQQLHILWWFLKIPMGTMIDLYIYGNYYYLQWFQDPTMHTFIIINLLMKLWKLQFISL